MLSPEVWQFTEMAYLYDAYTPLTSSGRREKAKQQLYVDAESLSKQYDLTDHALDLYRRRQDEMARVEYHLRHIGDIESISDPAIMGAAELFIVKRFLMNYRAVVSIIDNEARDAFGLYFDLGELLASLDVEENDTESFYISDQYRGDLAAIRCALREANDALHRVLEQLHEDLVESCNLDFRCREFLIVPKAVCQQVSRDKVFLEPYDNAYMIARPIMSEAYLELHMKVEALAQEQRRVEQDIREELAAGIAERFGDLLAAGQKLTQFDVSLARARLCHTYSLTRPKLDNEGPFESCGARLLPLEAACRQKDQQYWPLDVRLETPCCVIRGSNMCGKTIVLKTLGFCQLAAQLGFFVPARSYTTAVYEEISYVGPVASAAPEGISYFGMEIVTLAETLRSDARSKLLLMDEFARTTNSREAISLIGGLLEWLCQQPGLRAVMATHYQVIPDLAGLTDLVMKGLQWDRFDTECFGPGEQRDSMPLAERLRHIQACIEYELVPFSDDLPIGDALHVAAVIGLDREIVALAEKHAAMAKRRRNVSE